MKKLLLLIVFTSVMCNAQVDSLLPALGGKAPAFIMHLQANTIQSITFPYMNKIVLVHFWNTTSWYSRMINGHLKRLAKRYRNTSYKNADNFEIIAIAVQTDKASWRQVITEIPCTLLQTASHHALSATLCAGGSESARCRQVFLLTKRGRSWR